MSAIGKIMRERGVLFAEAEKLTKAAGGAHCAEPLCSARSRFEAWITAPPIERGAERWPDDETRYAWPRQYRDTAVQLAWESWCEAIGQDPFARDNPPNDSDQRGRAADSQPETAAHPALRCI